MNEANACWAAQQQAHHLISSHPMTEKCERWENKEWYGKTCSRWQQLAGEEGGRGSHDMWKKHSLKANGKRFLMRLTQWVKEKTNTWNKSCKESVERETELYKMVEAAVMDEKQEQKERGMIRGLLDVELEPEALWWTSTYKDEEKITLRVRSRTRAWELPFREVFEVLGYRYLRDGKGCQGAERTMCKGM